MYEQYETLIYSPMFPRSGLEWANSMAAILQHLFNAPAWREVLERHLSVCVSSLTEQTQPHLSAIFALFVVAGFPEVMFQICNKEFIVWPFWKSFQKRYLVASELPLVCLKQ